MYAILANNTDAATQGGLWGSSIGLIAWLVIIIGFFYFLMIRPQRKEQQKKDQMLRELAVGDTVLTTSGFYGVVIDVADDMVIVEFGSNKNCRIPMQKAAIVEIEKPQEAVEEKKDDKKDNKKDKEEKKDNKDNK